MTTENQEQQAPEKTDLDRELDEIYRINQTVGQAPAGQASTSASPEAVLEQIIMRVMTPLKAEIEQLKSGLRSGPTTVVPQEEVSVDEDLLDGLDQTDKELMRRFGKLFDRKVGALDQRNQERDSRQWAQEAEAHLTRRAEQLGLDPQDVVSMVGSLISSRRLGRPTVAQLDDLFDGVFVRPARRGGVYIPKESVDRVVKGGPQGVARLTEAIQKIAGGQDPLAATGAPGAGSGASGGGTRASGAAPGREDIKISDITSEVSRGQGREPVRRLDRGRLAATLNDRLGMPSRRQ